MDKIYEQYECDHSNTDIDKRICLKCGAIYKKEIMEWVKDSKENICELQ